jgi:hypothetical protein
MVNALEVVAGAAHEGIAETTKVGGVAHFFGKDVGDITFTSNC